MKIKLTANTHLNLPSNLSHIDFSYGFSFFNQSVNKYNYVNEDNSFAIKILAKFNNWFKLSANERQNKFSHAIVEAVDYANRNLNKLDDLQVQINAYTPINNLLKNGAEKILPLSHPILTGFANNAAHIRVEHKQIVIGTEHYVNRVHLKEYNKMEETVGFEKIARYCFFHELGHYVDGTINKNEEPNIYDSLLKKLKHLSNNSINKKEIDKAIKNSSVKNDFNKNDAKLMRLITQTKTFSRECYADVFSVLMTRNVDIEKQQYDFEKITQFINLLSNYRQADQLSKRKNDKFLDENAILNFCFSIDHFTSPALNGLEQRIKEFKNKPLSLDEIDKISTHATNQALSRMFYVIVNMNDNLNKQILLALNTEFNNSGMLEFKPSDTKNIKSFLEGIKNDAGENWIKNFHLRLERLKDIQLDTVLRPEAVFDIAMRPEKFERNLNASWDNTELKKCDLKNDDIVSEHQKKSASTDLKTWLNDQNQKDMSKMNSVVRGMYKTMKKIKDLRETSVKPKSKILK